MSENTYANIYQPDEERDVRGWDLVAMHHPNERDALRSASLDMVGYTLVAAAIPFIHDPERAERTVRQYQNAEMQGDVFG